MATQASLDLVQKLYVAYYGRPADAAGQTFWAEQIDSQGAAAVINDFGNSAEYEARFGDLSNEELVNNLYQQLFARDAEQGGLDFYVGKLESGELSLANIALVIAENAENADVDAMNNKVEAAQAFTDAAGSDYAGDDAADYAADFLSDVDADTDVSALDIDAVVADIPADDGGNDGDTGGSIDIDFANTGSSEGHFELDDSGSLIWVTDSEAEGYVAEANGTGGTNVVNIGKIEWDEAGQVATSSKDYTFHLSDQLGAGEEYNGLFLSPVLSAEDRTANSQLFIDLLDLRTADTDRPLGDLPVNGFRFTVDGEQVVLQSEEIFNAETYPQLLTAVKDALAASDDPLLAGFEATLGGEFQATDDNGKTVSGTTLVLTDKNGGVIEEGNFTYSEDASAGGFTLYGEQSTEAPQNIQELIETNLDLDNVGYGSQGGSINLVGESNSDKGIEQMNVSAENGVWLTRLESNNESVGDRNFLKEVNLSGDGYFRVGTQINHDVLGLEEINSEEQFGLVDVQDFNGGDFGGEIKLSGLITEEVIERDLNATDDAVDPKDDNATFNYTTAAGDDQISLAIDSDVMAREDVNLVIDSGDGNDVVETLVYDDAQNNGYDINDLTDQQLNANHTISTGAGDDVVRTWGQGDAVIGTGTGNDVVYADNSGLMGNSRDRWEFNSTAAAGALPNGQSNSDVDLSGGANGVGQTFGVENDATVQVQVTFKGHQSVWIDVPTTRTADNQDDEISTLQVNQAIKDAVNNDHVLANLLEASDGDGNILNVESLIDGNNLDELNVAFRDSNADTSADLSDIEAIYAEEAGNGATAAAQNVGGVDSTAESDNTIAAGEGNDVVVLGTGADSNDTLVLQDSFGNDDIVNFTSGDDTVANRDILDFTSYGVNNGTVGSNDYDVANDEVNVVTFAASDFDAETTFANLSADDIRDAIGSTVDNGRVDSIIMVEHANNAGQYKVFDLNSANDSTDYTVDLVGTLDFGESQALADANIA
ncbi:DUF4214 domain-containing protein [Halomonas organivorans]|uniref:DUF4214 domain-containing protein n=1 Tax=Halomonas organivorans TaxID=257772 RepID=A0A7W5C1H5_9GAMM|nr:DUF4214 domain-containing protein [Halomonas organivorans]MBB3142876.1 hypothetical protein [Halomonas organivorans]